MDKLTPLQIAVYAVNCPATDEHIDEVAKAIDRLVPQWVWMKDRMPDDDSMLVVFAKWYEPWGKFVQEECMTWKDMKGCRDYDLKNEWTHWIQIPAK